MAIKKIKNHGKLKTINSVGPELMKIGDNYLQIDGQQGIIKSFGEHISGNPYIRDEWSESNFSNDRPNSSVPWDNIESIIEMCWNAYMWDGIIGNVIDLMADFSVEGLEIQHQNRSVQSFLNNWWTLIKGNKITHNIYHDIFRAGNCIVQKRTSILNKELQDKISKAIDYPSSVILLYILHNVRMVTNYKIGSVINSLMADLLLK